jgi:predicted Holliday junction resolvase-like endonuclease
MSIDYIIFEEDKIIFLEIKSGNSQLSFKQRNIKKLIKEGKVEWDEMRIK